MGPIETILVIVDTKARHHAGLAKAALLAQKFRMRMDLLAIAEVMQSPEMAPAMASLARPLRDRGLEVTTATVSADSVNSVLVERLTGQRVKLIVKDVAQAPSSRRAALTRTDWELMRACPVPLLLSQPRLWSAVPQVCAAIDPGHDDEGLVSLDDEIMEQSGRLARCLEGQLHVIHADMAPTFVTTTPADGVVRAQKVSHELMATEHEARLRELRTFASGYQVPSSRLHFSTGPICEVLAGFVAQLPASIVVMGAVSRTPLRREVIGSTAEGLLRQISCDVLVVRAGQAPMSLH